MNRSRKDRDSLPRPFGKPVPQDEWKRIFLRVMTHSPDLNFYDGIQDFGTSLLDLDLREEQNSALLVDRLTPDSTDHLIFQKTTLLVRAQYFEAGVHHRISFDGQLLQEVTFNGGKAYKLRIFPPIQRVSNLFIALPSKDRPVMLEIPIEGAPPELRVIELSSNNLKAILPKADRLHARNVRVNGMKMQLFDMGMVLMDGTITNAKRDELDISIDRVSDQGKQQLDDYLQQEFIEQEVAPKATRTPDKVATKERKAPKANTALLLLNDYVLETKYGKILEELGWQHMALESWKKADPRLFSSADLLILSVDQDGLHAVDLIRNLIRDEHMLPKPFILVGTEIMSSREADWNEVGKGLFFRKNAPDAWLKNKMKKWLSSEIKQRREEVPEDTRQPLVLVVDDDLDNLEVESALLLNNAFRVIKAKDGWEAIRAARNLKPNLILLDIEMPGPNGLEVLRRLRSFELTRSIPIIMVTARQEMEKVDEAMEMGITDYIIKPFDEDILLSRVRTALA